MSRSSARAALRVLAGSAALMLAAAWLAGFVWFLRGAVTPEDNTAKADGIVVLTGGAERIATGVRLLQQGRGHVLLISGVGHGADLAAVLRGTGVDPASVAARITLGHSATSTAGNADETAAWVEQEHLASLIVVTASYHMPRALTELARSVPDVRLIPYAVLAPALRGQQSLGTLGLLAHEYTKWLASELGLARLNG